MQRLILKGMLWGICLGTVSYVWAGSAESQNKTSPAFHWLVQAVWEDSGFRLESVTKVPSGLPKQRSASRKSAWVLHALDLQGNVLHEVGLADPSVVRIEGPSSLGSNTIEGTMERKTEPIHFTFRLPLGDISQIAVKSWRPCAQRKPGTLEPLKTTKDNYQLLGTFPFEPLRDPSH